MKLRLLFLLVLGGARPPGALAAPEIRPPDWLHPHGVYLFEDNFAANSFTSWSTYTLDEAYAPNQKLPRAEWGNLPRVKVVPAPQLAPGRKAVLFTIPRGLNSFRAELALTAEPGFHERWYGQNVFIPADWVFNSPNPSDDDDIVLQWHHIITIPVETLGKYPPLAISIQGSGWAINSNYGVEGKAQRDFFKVPGQIVPGKWVSWVIHVKWSPLADGLLEIWRNGEKVVNKTGPNTYEAVKPRTPYWMIGLYHPLWKSRNAVSFNSVSSPVPQRTILITDTKMGDEHATYAQVAPPPPPSE